MIPIKDMQFVTVQKDGEIIIRGKLTFGIEYPLTKQAKESARFDLMSDVKDKMKADVWGKAYGELTEPLRELVNHALRNAPSGQDMRVRELADQLQALLSFHRALT